MLQAESIAKDVIVPEELDVNWIHRKTTNADIYFVASKMDKPIDVALSFNLDSVYPQIWDAVTGETRDAKIWNIENSRTNVTLSLPSSGSSIVVFPKGDKKPYGSKISLENEVILDSQTGWFKIHEEKESSIIAWKGDTFVTSKTGKYKIHQNPGVELLNVSVAEKELQSDWKISFEAGWNTPATIQIDELKSLAEHKNTAVQHYSGTTTYSKSFNLAEEGKLVSIDLGKVANIAEVWCNGKKVGVKWAPPFSFDLTDVIKVGENSLEIKVTNTWRNQLIFDNTRTKEQKKTWTSNPPKKDETELEASGLIGPVVIRTQIKSSL